MLWRKQSSIYALTRLAFLFGASFFAVIPVSAQILNPNVIGTEQENEKNRPRDIDDFRLAINPGVVVLAEDLTIKRNETDTVESIAVLDGGARASWHVDLTTADWKLGEHVGLHLQAWAGNMHYKKQVINTLNERLPLLPKINDSGFNSQFSTSSLTEISSFIANEYDE